MSTESIIKLKYSLYALQGEFKVDSEDHFLRPGFLHTKCVFLGYKASNSIKKSDVSDV